MNEEGITRLEPDTCPHCKRMLDAAAVSTGESIEPSPGDVTVCLRCGHPMVFTEAMRVRSMTPEEWQALSEKQRRELLAVRMFAEHIAPSVKAQWN